MTQNVILKPRAISLLHETISKPWSQPTSIHGAVQSTLSQVLIAHSGCEPLGSVSGCNTCARYPCSLIVHPSRSALENCKSVWSSLLRSADEVCGLGSHLGKAASLRITRLKLWQTCASSFCVVHLSAATLAHEFASISAQTA